MDSSSLFGSDLPFVSAMKYQYRSWLRSGTSGEMSLKRDRPSLTAKSLECNYITSRNVADQVPPKYKNKNTISNK